VAVVVAALVYMLFGRRMRQAAIFGVTVASAFCRGSFTRALTNPTMDERLAHGGTISFSYEQLVAMARPGRPESGYVSIGDRIARAGRNLAGIAGRDTGAILVPAFYRGPSESGQEVLVDCRRHDAERQHGARRRDCCGVVSTERHDRRGWLRLERVVALDAGAASSRHSMGLILLVGSQTFRYLVPLTPYLLLFFWRASEAEGWRGLQCCAARLQRARSRRLHLPKLTATPDWLAEAGEVDEVLDWMSSTFRAWRGGLQQSGPRLPQDRPQGAWPMPTQPPTIALAALGVRYVVAPADGRAA
jgi:hypothetical protein